MNFYKKRELIFDENIAKMEELGIYNGNNIDKLINLYEETKKTVITSKIQLEIEK